MNKFVFSALSLLFVALGMSSCFPTATRVEPIASVSVVFPMDDENKHWQYEQGVMIDYLSTLNLSVYYARAKEGDGKEQAAQIKQMESWGVQYIVLASVDTYSQDINAALYSYVQAGGKVICYDRLQQNTPSVAAYVSTSYKTVGELQAAAIDKLPEGSKIEIISGPSYDVNASTIFAGVNDIISHRMSNGMWVCPSGRTTYDQTKMDNWGKDKAYDYFKKLLDAHYPDPTLPDAVLVASDAQAAAVAEVIANRNPTLLTYPIITGLGNDEDAWRRIISGRQTMTVFRDLDKFIIESSNLLLKMVKKESLSTSQSMSNGLIDVPYVEIPGLKAIYKKDITNQ